MLQKRQPNNEFAPIWTTEIDPESRFVNRAERAPVTRREPDQERLAGAQVDLLMIGEGYTEAELPKFHGDAKRLMDALFAQEPLRSRRSDFNVWVLDLPSAESGVNRPNAGVFRRTPLSAEYNILILNVTC